MLMKTDLATKKLYEKGDIVMEQWFDSLLLSDLPTEIKTVLKQFVFFKNDIPKENIDFSKLPNNAPYTKNLKYKNVHLSSYIQTYFAKYIHTLTSKLYQYNPDILGEKQIPLNTELILNPKSEKIIEVKYTQHPTRLSFNIKEFTTTIPNEDTLAFVLAHELMHLTLREKYKWINDGKTEESFCDVMALICMTRAGYRPAEAAIWAINQTPECWYLLEYVKNNEIPINPTPHEKLFFAEACYIGLMQLPPDKQEILEPEQEFMFQLGVHPHALIRGIYLTKINNVLINKKYIEEDNNREKITPLDATFLRLIHDFKNKKISVYPKKSYIQNKLKAKKQRQKT